MFTGLVLEMGEIALIQQSSSGATLSLFAGNVSAAADIGDSIAVNGVCLTVVTKKDKALSFDVSNETIRSTNLETLKPGDRVNLEPALRPDSKIGGHFVTGHVDAVGKIRVGHGHHPAPPARARRPEGPMEPPEVRPGLVPALASAGDVSE